MKAMLSTFLTIAIIFTLVLIKDRKHTIEYRESLDRYLELLENLPTRVAYEEKFGYFSSDTAYCHVRITNMPYRADTTIYFQIDQGVHRKYEIEAWVYKKDLEYRNQLNNLLWKQL